MLKEDLLGENMETVKQHANFWNLDITFKTSKLKLYIFFSMQNKQVNIKINIYKIYLMQTGSILYVKLDKKVIFNINFKLFNKHYKKS